MCNTHKNGHLSERKGMGSLPKGEWVDNEFQRGRTHDKEKLLCQMEMHWKASIFPSRRDYLFFGGCAKVQRPEKWEFFWEEGMSWVIWESQWAGRIPKGGWHRSFILETTDIHLVPKRNDSVEFKKYAV